MLDFYYKYHTNKFADKASKLSKELVTLFSLKGIAVCNVHHHVIDEKYISELGSQLFELLNSLYYTLEQHAVEDILLSKYLDSNKNNNNNSEFRFADFFCGAGGLSEGITQSGFDPAFVNDHNIDALETYYFNHNLSIDSFFGGKIEALTADTRSFSHLFNNIKLVAGGPPCQGFSMANRQPLKDDHRNKLYRFFLTMISEINPEWFIMENVRGMKNKELEIESDIRYITNDQYRYCSLLLNAKDFGVPQNRERYFLIGNRIGVSPEQIKARLEEIKKSSNEYFLKDALYGLPIITTNPHIRSSHLDSEEHGHTIRKVRVEKNTFTSDINLGLESDLVLNHKSRFNNSNDLEIFRRLQPGQDSTAESIQDIIKYKNRKDIFKDKYKKLREDDVCKTITSHMRMDCHMYIHPSQARGLSPREAARIQSFPDNYFFRGSLNDWYYQIGNAVPVKLSKAIAQTIKSFYL